MIVFRLLPALLLNHLPKIADSAVGHALSVFDRPVLILIDQIRLHRLILFIINVKASRAPQGAALVRIEGFLFFLSVDAEQRLVISAEVVQMRSDDLFIQILPVSRKRKCPAEDLLVFEIFFHHIVDLRPYCIIEDQVIRRRLHRMNRGRAADKKVGNSVRPLKFAEQHGGTSLWCGKIFFQKGSDIIFQINPLPAVRITDLADIFRQMKVSLVAVRLLFVFFIDNLNHAFHPFLPTLSRMFREKDRFGAGLSRFFPTVFPFFCTRGHVMFFSLQE